MEEKGREGERKGKEEKGERKLEGGRIQLLKMIIKFEYVLHIKLWWYINVKHPEFDCTGIMEETILVLRRYAVTLAGLAVFAQWLEFLSIPLFHSLDIYSSIASIMGSNLKIIPSSLMPLLLCQNTLLLGLNCCGS